MGDGVWEIDGEARSYVCFYSTVVNEGRAVRVGVAASETAKLVTRVSGHRGLTTAA